MLTRKRKSLVIIEGANAHRRRDENIVPRMKLHHKLFRYCSYIVEESIFEKHLCLSKKRAGFNLADNRDVINLILHLLILSIFKNTMK